MLCRAEGNCRINYCIFGVCQYKLIINRADTVWQHCQTCYGKMLPAIPTATHQSGVELHVRSKSKRQNHKITRLSSMSHSSHRADAIPAQCNQGLWYLFISIHLPQPNTHGNSLAGIPSSAWIAQQCLACSSSQLILWMTLPLPASRYVSAGKGGDHMLLRGGEGGLSLLSITPDRLELIPASGRVISPHSGRAKAVIIVGNRTCNATLMAKGLMPLFRHEQCISSRDSLSSH